MTTLLGPIERGAQAIGSTLDDADARLDRARASEPAPTPTIDAREAEEVFATDSLAVGVIAMAVMTVVQKGIGFLRGIAFGYWLDDVELGRWSLVFGFLNLAAPLIVLGVPGTFGRYLGEFFDRGQARAFLTRTLAFTAVSAAIGIGALLAFADQASWLVFGDANERSLLVPLAGALVGVLLLNTASEIFTALRVNRLVSSMQFVHATAFAILSVGLLAANLASAEVLIAVYGVAAAIAAIPGFRMLATRWRRIPIAEESPAWDGVRRRLAAMAFWIWTVNLLSNLFDAADRYVLIHLTGLDAEASQGLVGQYQSSLLLPALFVSMGAAFGAALLPHLARKRASEGDAATSALLVTATKFATIVFAAGGFAVLWARPLLFDVLWHGKYQAGESVLGLALLHGVWLSAAFLLQNWLWCVERARLGAAAFAIGLTVNVAANVVAAPWFGLPGVVVATLAGDACATIATLMLARRYGLRTPPALFLALAAPIALVLGTTLGTAIFLAVVGIGLWRGQLLTTREIEQLRELSASAVARFRKSSSTIGETP